MAITEDGVAMYSPTRGALAAPAEHELEYGGIGSKPLSVLHGRNEAGAVSELEPLVDHNELRRDDHALNRTKLHAFNRARMDPN